MTLHTSSLGTPVLAAAAPTPTSAMNSPLARFLRDPSAAMRLLGHLLAHLASAALLHVVPPLVGVVLLVVALTGLTRRLRASRSAGDAAYLEILPPPAVDRAGAAAFWSNAHGLLSSGSRLLAASPQVAFETHIAEERVRFRLVVPRAELSHLARAVAAAWPGATAVPVEAKDVVIAGGSCAGRELRLRRVPWLPIAIGHDLDPLRAVLGAAAELGASEHAIVQVLCRPASRRVTAKAQRGVLAIEGIAAPGPVLGMLGPVVHGVLDVVTGLITPGPSSSRRTPRPSASSAALPASQLKGHGTSSHGRASRRWSASRSQAPMPIAGAHVSRRAGSVRSPPRSRPTPVTTRSSPAAFVAPAWRFPAGNFAAAISTRSWSWRRSHAPARGRSRHLRRPRERERCSATPRAARAVLSRSHRATRPSTCTSSGRPARASRLSW